jgi:hypothetical protein
LQQKIMVAKTPEPRGAVKVREAQRSDRRSRLDLDGEHGSGTRARPEIKCTVNTMCKQAMKGVSWFMSDAEL